MRKISSNFTIYCNWKELWRPQIYYSNFTSLAYNYIVVIICLETCSTCSSWAPHSLVWQILRSYSQCSPCIDMHTFNVESNGMSRWSWTCSPVRVWLIPHFVLQPCDSLQVRAHDVTHTAETAADAGTAATARAARGGAETTTAAASCTHRGSESARPCGPAERRRASPGSAGKSWEISCRTLRVVQVIHEE